MLIKIIFFLFIKFNLISYSINEFFFWKKKINIHLFFFSKNFIKKVFVWKKNFSVIKKFRIMRLLNAVRKRKRYKHRKKLINAYSKKIQAVFPKKFRRQKKKISRIKKFLWYFNRRNYAKYMNRVLYKSDIKPRVPYTIYNAGWRKGMVRVLYKPSKYSKYIKKYAPHLISVGQIVYEKLGRRAWNKKSCEQKAKQVYYFLENKKRGFLKIYTYKSLKKKFYYLNLEVLRRKQFKIIKPKRFRKKKARQILKKIINNILRYKKEINKSKINDLRNLYLFEKNLYNFKKSASFSKLYKRTNFVNYSKMAKFYFKKFQNPLNIFKYKKFIKNFKKSFVFKKVFRKNYYLNFSYKKFIKSKLLNKIKNFSTRYDYSSKKLTANRFFSKKPVIVKESLRRRSRKLFSYKIWWPSILKRRRKRIKLKYFKPTTKKNTPTFVLLTKKFRMIKPVTFKSIFTPLKSSYNDACLSDFYSRSFKARNKFNNYSIYNWASLVLKSSRSLNLQSSNKKLFSRFFFKFKTGHGNYRGFDAYFYRNKFLSKVAKKGQFKNLSYLVFKGDCYNSHRFRTYFFKNKFWFKTIKKKKSILSKNFFNPLKDDKKLKRRFFLKTQKIHYNNNLSISFLKSSKIFNKKIKRILTNRFFTKHTKKKKYFNLKKNFFSKFKNFKSSTPHSYNHFKNYFRKYKSKNFVKNLRKKNFFNEKVYFVSDSNEIKTNWIFSKNIYFKLFKYDQFFYLNKNKTLNKKIKTFSFFFKNKKSIKNYFNNFNFVNKTVLFKNYLKKCSIVNIKRRVNMLISNAFKLSEVSNKPEIFRLKYLKRFSRRNTRAMVRTVFPLSYSRILRSSKKFRSIKDFKKYKKAIKSLMSYEKFKRKLPLFRWKRRLIRMRKLERLRNKTLKIGLLKRERTKNKFLKLKNKLKKYFYISVAKSFKSSFRYDYTYRKNVALLKKEEKKKKINEKKIKKLNKELKIFKKSFFKPLQKFKLFSDKVLFSRDALINLVKGIFPLKARRLEIKNSKKYKKNKKNKKNKKKVFRISKLKTFTTYNKSKYFEFVKLNKFSKRLKLLSVRKNLLSVYKKSGVSFYLKKHNFNNLSRYINMIPVKYNNSIYKKPIFKYFRQRWKYRFVKPRFSFSKIFKKPWVDWNNKPDTTDFLKFKTTDREGFFYSKLKSSIISKKITNQSEIKKVLFEKSKPNKFYQTIDFNLRFKNMFIKKHNRRINKKYYNTIRSIFRPNFLFRAKHKLKRKIRRRQNWDEKRARSPFRKLGTGQIYKIFGSRKFYSFFLNSYKIKKKKGYYRRIFYSLYKKKFKRKIFKLKKFRNKGQFLRKKFNFILNIPKKDVLFGSNMYKFKYSFKKLKFLKDFSYKKNPKRIFNKKVRGGLNSLSLRLFKLNNKKFERFNHYKNLRFYKIFSTSHLIKFRLKFKRRKKKVSTKYKFFRRFKKRYNRKRIRYKFRKTHDIHRKKKFLRLYKRRKISKKKTSWSPPW